MRQIIFLIIYTCLLFSSCKDHTTTLNSLVKDLFVFKDGSTWTYYDSINKDTVIMTVFDYKETKFGGMCGGIGSMANKREFLEMITFSIILNFDTLREVWLYANDCKIDNTATTESSWFYTPIGMDFAFTCDENNMFSIPTTFMHSYSVNNVTYSDVYLFEYKDIKFYIAKNIGYIQCIQADKKNLVLIKKNIKQ